MSNERISLVELNSLDSASFVSHLGWIYEHSPWVAEEAWRKRPFGSLKALHSEMDAVVRDAKAGQRLALLQAHPDLAGRLAIARELTPASKEEQSKAGLADLGPEQL